ncbi:Uncharacterised protein [Mycobacterium tuberculosis]|uniref:Uncharacterized protein n=1 Tax=Mycobacterium tuberculosis TaxID=1773 RepID=A0A655FNQ6_MYCTX|nr:Uncharacterised protein [Mycobacterium tuberculosis]CKT92125.1 Uncharacterised protein [Mycobacterium tuberculosis]CNV94557.1 Uncharacterised protein [Mycobacterium tuberculosis]CNW37990.1 Uncharacterised protein [Mycobacterium tuberculosis]COV15357.1 Uncharacterised protein [Mycobacterium tuberculosis]
MGQHVDLAASRAIGARARDDLEVLLNSEVAQDSPCGRLCLGGGDGQPDTGGAQVGQQRPDPVEQAVHRPTAGAVVGPVGYDRLLGGFAEPHGAQRLMHGRADDVSGQVAFGYWGTDVVERVSEAGYDSARRVGQRAVQIEDHQLRRFTRRRCAPCGGAWRRRAIGPARGRVGHDPIVVDEAVGQTATRWRCGIRR